MLQQSVSTLIERSSSSGAVNSARTSRRRSASASLARREGRLRLPQPPDIAVTAATIREAAPAIRPADALLTTLEPLPKAVEEVTHLVLTSYTRGRGATSPVVISHRARRRTPSGACGRPGMASHPRSTPLLRKRNLRQQSRHSWP